MDNLFWRGTSHDKPQNGRPSDEVNDGTIAYAHALIYADRRFTVSDIFQEMVISYSYGSISH